MKPFTRLSTPTIVDIMDRARDAYSGWRGWHHSWNWPRIGTVPAEDIAAKIAEEATHEAEQMRLRIEDLKERRRKALELVDMCRGYIADVEANS